MRGSESPEDGEAVVSMAKRPDGMALVQYVAVDYRHLHHPEEHLPPPLDASSHK